MAITDKNGPFKIRLLKTVTSDLPAVFGYMEAAAGEHDAWCNRFGAVWVVANDGSDLGVRPAEFEYITFPPDGLPLAVTPAGARKLVDRLTRGSAA